mgnify:CR=1 FL=1
MTLAVWFLPLLMRRLRRLAGIEVPHSGSALIAAPQRVDPLHPAG